MLAFKDIYTPGSYGEYSPCGTYLRESPDMVKRFLRDFEVVVGDAINADFA
jgi:hypothetical protein